MILLLDNYDSFTFNLVQYFEQLDCDVHVVRNDAISAREAMALNAQAICISPGPGHPKDAGITLDLINAAQGLVPLFGVCLGMQALIHSHGGHITHAPLPMHGKTSAITHAGGGVFEGLAQPLTVCRYHSLCAYRDALPDALQCDAWSEDGVVMGVSKSDALQWGVQFHPEAILTQSGLELIANFLRLAKIPQRS